MRHLVILVSILVLNTAIRVPNTWDKKNIVKSSHKETRPRRADEFIEKSAYLNKKFGVPFQPPADAYSPPIHSGWGPLIPHRAVKVITKPKNYKKFATQVPKKNKYLSQSLKPSSLIVLEKNKNLVPYITYKKPNNVGNFIFTPSSNANTFYNAYPQTLKKQKPLNNIQSESIVQTKVHPNVNVPLYTNLDQSFYLPVSQQTQPSFPEFRPDATFLPSLPQLNQGVGTSFTSTIPEQNYQVNTFEPEKNNIQYFENFDKNHDHTPSQPLFPKNIIVPKNNDLNYYSQVYKNYRDDKTHEPEGIDPHYINEEYPKFERKEVEKAQISSHEHPAEIPTKPIYPGQGLWAKPGLKHRPFISQQKYEELKEDKEKPSGYDTFAEGQNLFENHKNNLGQQLNNFSQKHKFNTNTEQQEYSKDYTSEESPSGQQEAASSEETNENEEEEGEKNDEFVPTRLYAQVRASEDKTHLPEDEDDGRLREAIKESKVHTVYTEEGYEDSAYDHAGHEKEAANDEGFEDQEREKLEKKEKQVPHKKYNLHLPKYSVTQYSNGNDLLTDEKIAKIKEQELGLGDTDTAGTQFEDIGSGYDRDLEDSRSEDNTDDYPEQETPTTKTPRKQTNNFISTKETKTMTTKEKDDGNTETEISSKVKVILQPNNSTKSQKYVKVYPKVYKTIYRNKKQPIKTKAVQQVKLPLKEDTTGNFNGIFIEEIIPTTDIPVTKLPPTQYDDIQDEIPITTLPTTAIPKPVDTLDTLGSINQAFLNIDKRIRRRVKRFTNDFTNLRLEGHFLPLISHDLPEVVDNSEIKYPYYDNYQQVGLDENSPLRYSEDLKNIPKKSGKRMVFYEEAEKKVSCPEIEATLNPVPERVLNAEKSKKAEINEAANEEKQEEGEEEERKSEKQSGISDKPKGPRLAGLGNQIDCLKTRYFGENPLDSPFFKEETVGTLKPIFNIFDPKNSKPNENVEISKENNKSKQKKVPSQNSVKDDEYVAKNKFKNVKYHIKMSEPFGDKTANTQDTPKILNKINRNPTTSTESDLYIQKYVNMKEFEDQRNILSTPQSIHTISLLTTPKYTVTLKPKHIYHQIELLKYLPDQYPDQYPTTNNSSINETNQEKKSTEQSEAIDEDSLTYESSDDNIVVPRDKEPAIHEINKGNGPPFLLFDVNKFLPNRSKTNQPSTETQSNGASPSSDLGSRQSKAMEVDGTNGTIQDAAELPSAEELRRRRKIRKKRPPFQIFDINKFLPTTPRPIFHEIITTSTVLPKYQVHSEVSYKDDIKPNEQLHVFTDILNNINNASQEQQMDASIQSSEPISVAFGSKEPQDASKVKHIGGSYYKDSYLQAYGDQEIDVNYYSHITSTTTTAPSTTPLRPVTYRPNKKFHIRKTPNKPSPPQVVHLNSQPSNNDREEKLKLYLSLLEAKKQMQHVTPVNNLNFGPTIPVIEREYEHVEKTTKVVGMRPPAFHRYKTIHHPKRDNSLQFANPGNKIIKINKFFVVGLRPPPKQRGLLYSDFNNNVFANNRNILIRGKRSTTSKGPYSSLSRNRGQQEDTLETVKSTSDIEDEDYVPHRSKNYYYDEKTGKIVYLTTNKPQKSEEEGEIEYEEIIEEPPSTTSSKPLQDPIFKKVTPPPPGESYTDFVKTLKESPGYKFIPDPTTTEKDQTNDIKMTTTTIKPQSTRPPEFLNILSKVRQNPGYKLIEDKKEDTKEKKSKTTTTESVEKRVDEENKEEEEEEEESIGNIQNSPGAHIRNHYEELGIFDVTDFIPKIKNYLPRTSYDITKYKTISRPTSKPTPATENDSEEDEEKVEMKLTPTSTTQRSFIIITEEDIDSLNEATVTKETEQVPVVLQRRRLTTTSTEPSVVTTTSSEKPTTKSLLQYRRRRPTILRSTATTTQAPSITLSTSSLSEIAHPDKLRRNYRRRPSRITTEHTTAKFLNEESEDTIPKVLRRRSDTVETSSPKVKGKDFVETFKMYHRNKKHGGGYKKANNEVEQLGEIKNVSQSLSDVQEDVEVIADYDKNKRHGGNYRKVVEEEKITKQKENTDTDYENINEDSTVAEGKPLVINLLPKDNEEQKEEIGDEVDNVSEKYNPRSEYKSVSSNNEEHKVRSSNTNEFSTTSRNRGNYTPRSTLPKKISSNNENEESTEVSSPREAIRSRIRNNRLKKNDTTSKKKHVVTEPISSRLTDVVPKPDSFYKDPSLPLSVNMLASGKKVSSDEISSINSSTEPIDSSEESYGENSTKKPFIVKDPSKRLYYYAPI